MRLETTVCCGRVCTVHGNTVWLHHDDIIQRIRPSLITSNATSMVFCPIFTTLYVGGERWMTNTHAMSKASQVSGRRRSEGGRREGKREGGKGGRTINQWGWLTVTSKKYLRCMLLPWPTIFPFTLRNKHTSIHIWLSLRREEWKVMWYQEVNIRVWQVTWRQKIMYPDRYIWIYVASTSTLSLGLDNGDRHAPHTHLTFAAVSSPSHFNHTVMPSICSLVRTNMRE